MKDCLINWKAVFDVNLVCYPHYAAGGLVCNILNNQPNTNITSATLLGHGEHELFIGDSDDVFDEYSVEAFNKKYQALLGRDSLLPWQGTHCHPKLLDQAMFESILSITTASIKSKLYRWIRVYNLYFAQKWTQLPRAQHDDKMRSTAKSYLLPFYQCNYSNAFNLEFSDIVEKTPRFTRLCRHLAGNCDLTKVDQWLEHNSFLTNFTSTKEYEFFMQAEYEISTQQAYEFQ
jgi:hypothetical protein